MIFHDNTLAVIIPLSRGEPLISLVIDKYLNTLRYVVRARAKKMMN